MGSATAPDPVKLFMGIIACSESRLEAALPLLEQRWGRIALRSAVIPFDFTGYYEAEMGAGLLRQWVGFEALVSPGQLAAVKTGTNALEAEGAPGDKRSVNLDPGYLALSKIVLASTKDFSHRIYLSDGIYAEITLLYKGGKFTALPWSYPDYQCAAAREFFTALRAAYHAQLQQGVLP